MLRRAFHIIFSLWLVTLLLFGVTPKEAMHAFASHHDTVHRCDSQGPYIDAAHHHCSFLGFELMAFSAPVELRVMYPAPFPEYISFLPIPDERAAQQVMALREGRGPPVKA